MQQIEGEVEAKQQAALKAKGIEYDNVFAVAKCEKNELIVDLTVTRPTAPTEEETNDLVLLIGDTSGKSAELAASNSFSAAIGNTNDDEQDSMLWWILLGLLGAALLATASVVLFFMLRPQVYVKLPSGRLERINISLNSSVLQLKNKLSQKTGLDPSQIRLLSTGVTKGQKSVGPTTQRMLAPDSAVLGKDLGLKKKSLINLQTGPISKASARSTAAPTSMFRTRNTAKAKMPGPRTRSQRRIPRGNTRKVAPSSSPMQTASKVAQKQDPGKQHRRHRRHSRDPTHRHRVRHEDKIRINLKTSNRGSRLKSSASKNGPRGTTSAKNVEKIHIGRKSNLRKPHQRKKNTQLQFKTSEIAEV